MSLNIQLMVFNVKKGSILCFCAIQSVCNIHLEDFENTDLIKESNGRTFKFGWYKPILLEYGLIAKIKN